jgi:hypothetical protein
MLDRTLIIGFGYKARMGKGTCVQAIMAQRGSSYSIHNYAFADALKEEVAGREFELCMKYGLTYEPDNKHRTLLQFYGTQRRAQDPHYWVKKVLTKMRFENPQIALISDVRFYNELNFIKSFNGYAVKVEREQYVDLSPNAGHVSEVELDSFTEWDATLTVLDGEVDQLKKDAVTLFDYFVGLLDYTSIMEPMLSGPGIINTSNIS